MFLFSFLILPVFLAWYCFYKKNSKIVPTILIGTVCAVLLCLFLALFTFSHRIIPYSYSKNLIHLLLTQTVLPLLLPYILFLIISKDDWKYKTESFLPFNLSFYAVYLPFIILTTSEGLYSGFSLFIKPVLFLIMIMVCSFSLKKIYESIASKKIIRVIILIIFFVIAMILPSVMEALYLVNLI